MSTSRPWWASDGPVGGGIDRSEDPLDVHRAARRGPEPDGDGDRDDRPPEQDQSGRSASGPTHAGAEVCGVCPICIAARVLGETRPELLGHLTEAGRHLAAAMRTFLETGPDRPDGEPGRRPPDEVRRIDLD